MPILFPKPPTLTGDELQQLSDALNGRAGSSSAADAKRLRFIAAKRPALRAFVAHAYVHYLHTGGACRSISRCSFSASCGSFQKAAPQTKTECTTDAYGRKSCKQVPAGK